MDLAGGNWPLETSEDDLADGIFIFIYVHMDASLFVFRHCLTDLSVVTSMQFSFSTKDI